MVEVEDEVGVEVEVVVNSDLIYGRSGGLASSLLSRVVGWVVWRFEE